MLVTFNQLGRLGRLGNQLFQIAATIGEARQRGWEYALSDWAYADYFAGSLQKLPASAGDFPIYREPTFFFRTPDFVGSTQLLGYFQSERYFAHCAAEIRELFRPKSWIIDQCCQQCGRLFESATCSVHVRRGDYVNHPQFVDLAASDYYETALELLPPNTRFLVFSDDISYCQQRFRGKQFAFVHSNHEVVDLYLMSQCGAHVIANSSFSWWGAWLNSLPDKLVIAPQRWFQGDAGDSRLPFVPGPPHRGFHDTRDLIPAGWRII